MTAPTSLDFMMIHSFIQRVFSPLVGVSANWRHAAGGYSKSNPFVGKVMGAGLSLVLMAITLVFVPQAYAWTEGNVDLGIGFLGPASGETVQGLFEEQGRYSPAQQEALTKLVFRRQPFETHPVVGQFAFNADAQLGVRMQEDFIPVSQGGYPLENKAYGLAILKQQNHWVHVRFSQTPFQSGWVKLPQGAVFRVWLWYHYMAHLVKSKQAVFFITPFRDDLLYQANPQSLSALKNVFDMEDTVLYPKQLNGPYMLVETGKPLRCPDEIMPVFQPVEPFRAWVKWLQSDGRPKVFRYNQKHCADAF